MIDGSMSWEDLKVGLYFSVPFLLIFTFHEFGHYFVARINKVKASLPYFIPLPPIPLMIGTLGAVIRLKERVKSTKVNFDIGIAGPLAGFVIALITTFYGYTHLPEPDYVTNIHPYYKAFGENFEDFVYTEDTILIKSQIKEFLTDEELSELPDTMYLFPSQVPMFQVNKSIIINLFEKYVVPEEDKYKIPNAYEFAHYPFLFAGFLAFFFTALNLLPVGQLDGGHVIYGLFGAKWHGRIATTTFFILVLYGGLGIFDFTESTESLLMYVVFYGVYLFVILKGVPVSKQNRILIAVSILTFHFLMAYSFPHIQGFRGWLLYGLLLGRAIGIYHPPALSEVPLDQKRVILGWISLLILILCFSFEPLGLE